MDNDNARLMNYSDKFKEESNGEDKELEEIHEIMEGRDKLFKSMSKYEIKLIKGLIRGFGNTMILWLISKKRQHGYEIMTKLHESFPYGNKMPSASTIYPVLHDLEKNGLIKGSWEHHGKRKVKYYEITNEGKKVLFRLKKFAQHAKKSHSSLWIELMDYMVSI